MSYLHEVPRPIRLDEIEAARTRVSSSLARTPMFRLELGGDAPDIRLKLENLQPTNSYKIRGALNAVYALPDDARKRGVWTVSAGNAGQGIAYAARQAGIPCTVVVMETAPKSKVERMKALGAHLIPVPHTVAWKTFEEHAYPGLSGTFIHPFDNHDLIIGHGTLGLEILEQAPETSVVIAPIGGGGLVTGVASAVKALRKDIRILGAEPETAAPLARSFELGSPQKFPEWRSSFVDGAGGMSVFPRMWDRMQGLVDGSIVVSLDETRRALRLIADKARAIAEGAGALAVAAALSGRAGRGTIVAIVSGGNIDLETLCEILKST